MRTLVFLPLLLAGAWMAYWAIASTVLDRAVTGWLVGRESEGWVANFADVEVSGFPARFETTVSDIELADPETGVAWLAPEFRFTAHSARPTEITAIWPPEQTVASPFERIAVTSDVMQGRMTFAASTTLALQASDIALENVGLVSSSGWEAALTSGTLTTALSDLGEDAHHIRFAASGLALADTARAALDPARMLPAEISLLTLDAVVDFDAPWDRRAIEVARPQITAIDLVNLQATWGNLDLRAAGALTVDAAGVPTGRVTVKATNWREILAIAQASGALPEALYRTAERALGLLASLSGPPETLDAPLSFQNGYVSFGPLPLGPAPRLVLR